jgi:hypothetical protein
VRSPQFSRAARWESRLRTNPLTEPRP